MVKENIMLGTSIVIKPKTSVTVKIVNTKFNVQNNEAVIVLKALRGSSTEQSKYPVVYKFSAIMSDEPKMYQHGSNAIPQGVLEKPLTESKDYKLGVLLNKVSTLIVDIYNPYDSGLVLTVERNNLLIVEIEDKGNTAIHTEGLMNLEKVKVLEKMKGFFSNVYPDKYDFYFQVHRLDNLLNKAVIVQSTHNHDFELSECKNYLTLMPNGTVTLLVRGVSNKNNLPLSFDFKGVDRCMSNEKVLKLDLKYLRVSHTWGSVETTYTTSKSLSVHENTVHSLGLDEVDYLVIKYKNTSTKPFTIETKHKLNLEEENTKTGIALDF